MEQLAEAGIDFVLEAGPMDLEQEVGATAGPSHLPGFIHAAVDYKFAVPFGERCADRQTGTMALGIVGQSGALAGQAVHPAA